MISNLSVDRLCDRPQFARVKGDVSIPIDVLFIDQKCQEWMGQATLRVSKDVLLAIPDESIVPFTLESLVSAICVSGRYVGNCKFQITICVTVVLKILAEVEVMVPSYGFCEIPPCEEFAESVCDEFFSLPIFPRSSACQQTGSAAAANTSTGGCTFYTAASPPAAEAAPRTEASRARRPPAARARPARTAAPAAPETPRCARAAAAR